jgi:hypothetical protein
MPGPTKRNQTILNNDNDSGKDAIDNGKDKLQHNIHEKIVAVYIPVTKKIKIVGSLEDATRFIKEMDGLIESESKSFETKDDYDEFVKKVLGTDKNPATDKNLQR